MTGDGLQDILLVYDGNIEYWPNLGYGDWGRRIHMRNSPRFPFAYDPRRILIGDVDGDGLADLVYVDHHEVLLWINQSGNGWSEPIELNGTPPMADMYAVRLEDLLGTGMNGLLWSADLQVQGRDHMHFLDFTGGVKPYLLAEMANHMGAVTRVEYAPSTRFYLADQQDRRTRWQTPLPFPVQVVRSVEVIDQISRGKRTTEYRYHDGYWDGAEREWRGFGLVEAFDTEAFERYNATGLHGETADFLAVNEVNFSPPMLTKTWFHQGPVGPEDGDWQEVDRRPAYWAGDPSVLEERPGLESILSDSNIPRRAKRDAVRSLRGRVLRTEVYALDGGDREDLPYTISESIYDVREEDAPAPADADRQRIFFPHPVAQRVTQWERGDDPMTGFTFTGDYDQYGLPRTETTLACPRGRVFAVGAPPGEPYLGTHSVIRYAHRDDEAHYLVGRVAQTTTHEILNDGSPAVFDLLQRVRTGAQELRAISQTFTYYDGEAFAGLPLGQLGDFGAPVRSETLVLTEDILREAYRTGDGVLDPPEMPPYLDPAALPAWTEEYPQAFRDGLPALTGYTFHAGDDDHVRGYFAAATRYRYDFHENSTTARGLPLVLRDPLGRDVSITYDAFNLLAVATSGPTGLVTEARYDYRVMAPDFITDHNGNRTAYTFTPLGLLASTSIMGKEQELVGDTADAPGVRYEYDFLAFEDRGQPVSARTIAREHHVHDTDVSLPERNSTTETVEYSDGFGRLLQARRQADDVFFGDATANDANLPLDQTDPGGPVVGQQVGPDAAPRVVVNGWKVYDNKGRVVEEYEPSFAAGYDFMSPSETEMGRPVRMFYDPRGQLVRTLDRDGSEQRVIYGVPDLLEDPAAFDPTPWEVYTYDSNDNAGRTHASEAQSYQHHWNTPSSAVVDALGRPVEAIERNGADPVRDWFVTRSAYDIQGKLRSVTDALQRVAFRYVHDLAGNPLRVESIDAGVRRTVVDVLGKPVEQRDSKGALRLTTCDALGRPIRLWARDHAGQQPSLRQHLIYGDSEDAGLSRDEAQARNLLGQLVAHYDEAGRIVVDACDFKGNVLEKTREVVSDAAILAAMQPASPAGPEGFRVDWQPGAGESLEERAALLLDSFRYTTTTAFDAMNRITQMLGPQQVGGGRAEFVPRYNRAGSLESLSVDGDRYVDRVAYNAKGQRTFIAYGNGVMARYAYDPDTLRLARLRSERYTRSAELTYEPEGQALQDFGYVHDLAGNILTIRDRAPGSGIPNSLPGLNALDRDFAFDPLYRLVSATGRECDTPPPPAPWDDTPRCQDQALTRAYTENYRYDPTGNVEAVQHVAAGGSSSRSFSNDAGSNRLATATVGQTVFAYAHDANGNLLRENTERHFHWDHSDRMCAFRTQVDDAEPSVHAQYLYDAAGERVKKLVRRQGGNSEVTVYVDGFFEHHRRVQNGATAQNNTIHVMDDRERIASLRAGAPFPDDAAPAVTFHSSDHLGSSNVVTDGNGAFISREEYTPYGDTAFGSFSRKRYRWTGQERDAESGLYLHGARYYSPWLARWVSTDPLGSVDELNLYVYARNNPLAYVDPSGTANAPPAQSSPPNPRVDKCYENVDADAYWNNVDRLRSNGVDVDQATALSLFEYLSSTPRSEQSPKQEQPGMSKPTGRSLPPTSVQAADMAGTGYPPGIHNDFEAWVQHRHELAQMKKAQASEDQQIIDLFRDLSNAAKESFFREPLALESRYFHVLYIHHNKVAGTLEVKQAKATDQGVYAIMREGRSKNGPQTVHNYLIAVEPYNPAEGNTSISPPSGITSMRRNRLHDYWIARIRLDVQLSYMLVNTSYLLTESDYMGYRRIQRPPLGPWPAERTDPLRQSPGSGRPPQMGTPMQPPRRPAK